MPDKNNKTIAVIGMGSIGKRHDNNLVELGCLTIPFDPFVYNCESLMDRILEECDGVVIASPTSTHYDYILQGIAADKPVFVEKPIAGTKTQLEGLSMEASLNNLFVGYNLRFHPCVKQAKQWLDEGLIGTPLWANFVCAQYNDKPAYLRDGVILNWSHEIDLALHLLGPASVNGSATGLSNGHDTMADILLAQGCMTTIHLDYLTKPEQRGYKIVGTEGRIVCDLPKRVVGVLDNNDSIGKNCSFSDTSYDDDYKDEMQAFLDAIDGKPWSGATGHDGLDVLQICLDVKNNAVNRSL